MKKSLNFLLVLLTVATVFTACKKDDPAPTPAQLIVGKWKIVTYTATSGAVTVAAPACEMDNTTEFTAGGSAIETENTKCNTSDPATSTLTYSISTDGKTLTLGTGTASVGELTSTSLKITIVAVTSGGNIVTGNIAFAKI